MNMLYFSYLLSIMYICTFMRINIVIVIVIVIHYIGYGRRAVLSCNNTCTIIYYLKKNL